VFLVPLSIAGTYVALIFAQPEERTRKITHYPTTWSASHGKKHVAEPKPWDEPVYVTVDQWSERFHDFYVWWYALNSPEGRHFLGDPAPNLPFKYEHLRFLVWLAVLLGAPVAYWFLHPKDWDEYQTEATKEADRENAERRRFWDRVKQQLDERDSKLGNREHKLELRAKEISQAIAVRDQEIERLRLREKYLTEGKPKPLEETPDKPDLDDFL
jgi:hypothetical protein